MTPPRGLSISAIRKRDTERAIGRIKRTEALLLCSPKPTSMLQKTATKINSIHAAVGMRFHQLAWVYPWEFNTSFMPESTTAATGVGSAATGRLTLAHICV